MAVPERSENKNGADCDVRAIIFTLYIQDSRLAGVIGTFLEIYIWQRISEIVENQ
jgi:hypothetical protein